MQAGSEEPACRAEDRTFSSSPHSGLDDAENPKGDQNRLQQIPSLQGLLKIHAGKDRQGVHIDIA